MAASLGNIHKHVLFQSDLYSDENRPAYFTLWVRSQSAHGIKSVCSHQPSRWRHGPLAWAQVFFQRILDQKLMRLSSYHQWLNFWTYKNYMCSSTTRQFSANRLFYTNPWPWPWAYLDLTVNLPRADRERTLSWPWAYLELTVSVPWTDRERTSIWQRAYRSVDTL